MTKTKVTKAKNQKEITTSTNGPLVEIVLPTPITELSVDFPSEGLNNMANKINELIRAYNNEHAQILRS